MAALTVMTAAALLACQRSDPPPGSPAEVAPCPEDAGTELPRGPEPHRQADAEQHDSASAIRSDSSAQFSTCAMAARIAFRDGAPCGRPFRAALQ